MNEVSRSNATIKIYGIDPDKHQDVIKIIKQNNANKKQEAESKLTPAKLRPDQLHELVAVETAAGAFLTNKIKRLGITDDDISSLPSVLYSKKQKNDNKEEGGYHAPVTGTTVVYIDEYEENGLFDKFSSIVHELSHASVKKESRYYFSNNKGQPLTVARADGMGLIGGRQSLVGGIEEGMVILDQVDFFNSYLKNNYPQRYQERIEWARSKSIKGDVAEINTTLYGELTPEILAPFIKAISPNLPVIKKYTSPCLVDN